MDIQTKDFPVSAADDGSPFGSFEVVLSAPTLDRDGEIIDSRAFDPLPDHISFDTDHSMSCDSVVGSGVPYYAEDGTLMVKGTFCSDERSQTIRQKVAEGHIRSTSVTFMAANREKDEKGVPHITGGELLNGTFTPIPSNRESVVVAAKSMLMANLKAGARHSAKDAELLQAAHDAMCSLGAACATPDDPASGKSAQELSQTDESAVSADESADVESADNSADAADEAPDEVKAKSWDNQFNAAFL